MHSPENPYASPSAAAYSAPSGIQLARSRLFLPALGILLACGLFLALFTAAIVINIVMYFSGYPEVLDMIRAAPGHIILLYVLLLGGNVTCLYGSIAMLRGKSYRVCLSGAIAACIPVISPCYILGIPFGIWALVILLRKDTRTAFAETKIHTR